MVNFCLTLQNGQLSSTTAALSTKPFPLMHIAARLLACLLPALLAACGDSPEAPAQPLAASESKAAAMTATPVSSATAYHDMVQHFYVTYFGRPADVSGLDYWAGQYFQLGLPTTVAGFTNAYGSDSNVRAYVNAFGDSKESKDL